MELRRRSFGVREGTIAAHRTRKHRYEVDFAVGDVLDEAPVQLIQVTESVENAATAQRETRALWEALDETGLDEGLLIVGSGEAAVYEHDGKRIRQIPAWSWFLQR